jgi:hypothetical protein
MSADMYYYEQFCAGRSCPAYELPPPPNQCGAAALSDVILVGEDETLPENPSQVFIQEILHEQGTLSTNQTVLEDGVIDTAGKAIFSASWLLGEADVILIDPNLSAITPSNVQSYQNITYQAIEMGDAVTAIFMVQNPMPGIWTLSLTGVNMPQDGAAYTLTGREESTLGLTVVCPTEILTGTGVPISARLSDGDTPVTNASVMATIKAFDNSTAAITLYDDGNHNDGDPGDGIYANNWNGAGGDGPYSITVGASGTIAATIPFQRYAHAGFTVYHNSVVINANFSEEPLDFDGDGLYERLRIHFAVIVNNYTNGILTGVLVDADGNTVAVGSGNLDTTIATTGSMQAAIDFEGRLILNSGKNGPYYLKELNVYDDFNGSRVKVDRENNAYVTTGSYNYDGFK